MSTKEVTMNDCEKVKIQWDAIYFIGIITAVLVILGTILDIAIGTLLGGDLSAVPQNAVDRFAQFHSNPLLGLYNLDLLNTTTAVLMIPTYFALYGAHRGGENVFVKFSMVLFIIGTAVFVSNNVALPMLELSQNYFDAATESQKLLYSAAGETLLAQGVHGSAGAFIGFVLSILATLCMSIGMLKGKIFGKVTSYLGIAGSVLLLIYIVFVTFVPEIASIAMMIAAPGGICSLAWMIMFTRKLVQLKRSE